MTSPLQDGLWFEQCLAPDSRAGNLCRVYRVTGELDVAALHTAWLAVQDRHEALRTSFAQVDGRPQPKVAAAGQDAVFLDLHDRPASDPQYVDRLCAELAATPLRPDGPLARLTVLRVSARCHLLVLLLHGLIADAESLAVVLADLADGYAAAPAGEPAVRPSGPSYADFVREQRALTGTERHQRLLEWWRSALTPVPNPIALPADRVRPAEPSHTAGHLPFDWGTEVSRLARDLYPADPRLPDAVVLCGFAVLLARYAAQHRIAVGYAASTRPPGFERVVGPFGNQLVICADLLPGLTFKELLGQVTGRLRDALGRRDLPFPDLVQALPVDRDPHRMPLCDALFVPAAPQPVLRLGGTAAEAEPVHTGSVAADLTLTLHTAAPATRGWLTYRDCLFDPASAQQILNQLQTLLMAGLAKPDTAVAELPLQTLEQCRLTVRQADRIDEGPPGPRSVYEQVRDVARRQPDAPAIFWAGEVVSYGELADRAAAVTRALRATADVRGKAVAVRVPTGPRHVVALLGVLGAGGYLVCLGPGGGGQRGRDILAATRPACLVVDGPEDDLDGWYRAELAGRVLDMAAAEATTTAAPPGTPPDGSNERMYIAFTSGSTGHPKGIAQTHAGFAQFVAWLVERFEVGPGSRVAQWAAPGYDASLCQIFTPLVSGAMLCPVPERVRVDPKKLVDWLATERVTMFETVPTFARELLRPLAGRGSGQPPLALRYLLLAGETLPGELAGALRAALPDTRLFNLYGPTESILATWYEVTGAQRGTVPIGTAIPGRQVVVLDEQDRPCPPGVDGQIVIRSPFVAQGYVGIGQDGGADEAAVFRPVRGAAEFGVDDGPCYRTGDVGRLRWDGQLEFRNRRDAQIKFFGNRIELADIESALAGHRTLAQCAVRAVQDRTGLVVRLVAYVVPVDPMADSGALATSWRAHLRRRFGPSMPPVTFETLAALPRNAGGKVDRRQLPMPADVPRGRPALRPGTATDAEVAGVIAEIWSQLLGVGPEQPHDSFLALGGHSLLLAQLVDRVGARLGARPPLWKCLADPTWAGLTALTEATANPPTRVTDQERRTQ